MPELHEQMLVLKQQVTEALEQAVSEDSTLKMKFGRLVSEGYQSVGSDLDLLNDPEYLAVWVQGRVLFRHDGKLETYFTYVEGQPHKFCCPRNMDEALRWLRGQGDLGQKATVTETTIHESVRRTIRHRSIDSTQTG